MEMICEVVAAGLALSVLATLAVWVMCYVEARRGDE